MNLTPTEMDRLTIFTAAEMARRNKQLGIRLSHPEAVALITDEVMLAARRDMPYAQIRDMASRLLTTDDVEPGVAEMIPMIYMELAFAEGTKLMALFEPIAIGHQPLLEPTYPGQIFTPRARSSSSRTARASPSTWSTPATATSRCAATPTSSRPTAPSNSTAPRPGA